MNIHSSFILNIIDSHKNLGQIEKKILTSSMTNYNYVSFDILNVPNLLEHIEISNKYQLHHKISSLSRKGGSTDYIYTHIFPDFQTADNEIQNFYFSIKKNYYIDDNINNNIDERYSDILKKFILKDNYYETNIANLNIRDFIYLDEKKNEGKISYIIENNTLRLSPIYIQDVHKKEYRYNDVYQHCANIISSKLYENILCLNNDNNIYFHIYEFDKVKGVDSNILITIINIMLGGKYIFSKETNPDYDEDYYSTDQIYVLKKKR